MTTTGQSTSGKRRASIALFALILVLLTCGAVAYFGWPFDAGDAPAVRIEHQTSDDDAVVPNRPSLDKPLAEPVNALRSVPAASASDVQGESERQAIAPPAPPPETKTYVVRGRVLDLVTHAPVGEAGVVLETTPDFRARPGIVRADANGAFTVQVAVPGTWSFRVNAPMYAPLESEIALDPRFLELDLGDVQLAPQHRLTIRLLGPDGRRLHEWGAEHLTSKRRYFIVVKSDAPLGARWNESQGEAIGSLQLDSRGPTSRSEVTLSLPVPLPRYISISHESTVIASRELTERDDLIELTIPAEAFASHTTNVRLKVVDAANGAPIAQARVGINPPGVYRTGTHETDADGIARIDDVGRGRCYLTIVAKGYEWVHEDAVADAGRETDLGVFRLAPATTISGRVVDAGGAVSGVEVLAFPLDRFEKTRETRRAFPATSGASGGFSIPSLGRGKYLLRVASSEWIAPPTIVDTSGGAVVDASLRVARGFEVRFAIEEPIADTWLAIVDAAAVPVHEQSIGSDRSIAVRLLPGKYTWKVESAERVFASRPFTVVARALEIRVGR
jgi:hypothetical protein